MISLEPTEKQLALQEHFRRLAVKRLQPRSILVDAAEPAGVDPDYSAVIAEENLNAFLIPEEYGGKPLDWMSLAILFEELGAGCAGFAAVYAQTFHSVAALLIGGSEEQKKRFFPFCFRREATWPASASRKKRAAPTLHPSLRFSAERGNPSF